MDQPPYVRIYTDYNNQEENGDLRFNVLGSMKDIENLPSLQVGQIVTAYDEEVEVDARLYLSNGVWLGMRVSDYRYLDAKK